MGQSLKIAICTKRALVTISKKNGHYRFFFDHERALSSFRQKSLYFLVKESFIDIQFPSVPGPVQTLFISKVHLPGYHKVVYKAFWFILISFLGWLGNTLNLGQRGLIFTLKHSEIASKPEYTRKCFETSSWKILPLAQVSSWLKFNVCRNHPWNSQLSSGYS